VAGQPSTPPSPKGGKHVHFGDESSPELDIARLPTLKGSESSSEQDNSKRALKRKHLRVDCMFRVGENEPVRIRALIDTGAG